MTTSLATQLARLGANSLDATRLAAPTAKSRPSFLFPSRQAAALSNTDIYSLGHNGFLALLEQDARLQKYESPLFGEQAKRTDRTLLTKEENEELDGILAGIMRVLASRFMFKNVGRVLEWLIRRFRINELNVDALMGMILPYHETAQFAQMLQIMHLEKSSKFKALEAVKKSLLPMPRAHLITAVTKSNDLLQFIANFVEPYAFEGFLYPTLTAFWTGTLIGYLERVKTLQENEMAALLPALVKGLRGRDTDLYLGSVITLTRFAAKAELNAEAIELLLNAVLVKRDAVDEPDIQEAMATALVILCESQRVQLQILPKKAILRVLESPPLVDNLANICASHSARNFLSPFLTTLVHRAINKDERANEVLIKLVSPASCALQITEIALDQIIGALCSRAGPETGGLLQAANAISQRDIVTYRRICSQREERTAADPNAHEKLQKVLAAIADYSLLSGKAQTDGELSLSLSSSDAQARATALAAVLQTAASNLEDEESSDVLISLVLERVEDADQAVVKVLLSEDGKRVLNSIASQRADGLFRAFSSSINNRNIPADVKLAFTQYLLEDFLVAAGDDWNDAVLADIVWPQLLITKETSKVAPALLALVSQHISKFDLLQGISAPSDLDSKDNQLALNETLVGQLAKNCTGHEDRKTFLTDLLSQQSEPSTAQTLALAVALRMVHNGDHLLGSNLVEAMQDAQPKSLALHKAEALPSPEGHGEMYLNPRSKGTVNRLYSELQQALIRSLKSSEESRWCWLMPLSILSKSAKTSRELALVAYSAAHAAGVSTAKSTSIMQFLFGTIVSEDVLAFLAAVYTSARYPSKLRAIALRDTATFVATNAAAETGSYNDYQVLLPSLLVAIASGTKEMRTAAMSVIDKIANVGKKASAQQIIYGFDAFYGPSSNNLQYMDSQQFTRYVQIVQSHRNELLIDGNFLLDLHANKLLNPTDGSEKKKRALRHTVFCYLVSHSVAWRQTNGRTTIMRIVSNLHDSSRLDLLRPLLQTYSKSQLDDVTGDSESDIIGFAQSLIQSYATLPKAGLPDEDFSTICTILGSQSDDTFMVALRQSLRRCIKDSLFTALSSSQKVQLLEKLVTFLPRTLVSEMATHKETIHGLALTEESLCGYLDRLRISMSGQQEQSNKKTKTVSSSSRAEQVTQMTRALENVAIGQAVASGTLLRILIEILSTLVDLTLTVQGDFTYAIQLVLQTLSKVSSHLKISDPGVDETIRISPVLETIRTSTNPQTSNLALNLVADLVALVPDQVVQNIMPIFTFMGTNALQRDDAYSSRVVVKTIERVVPALVRYRRKRAPSRDQVIADLDDFLRVFVDAANHVPRHRRSNLFTHFVEVLGPRDFLAPTCSLLVDKVALKLIKTQDMSLLALPLELFAHFAADIQISSCLQLLNDLLSKLKQLNADGTEGSVASRASTPSTPADSPALPIKISRRSILASLAFLNNVIAAKNLASKVDHARATDSQDFDSNIQELIRTAMSFYSVVPQKLSESDIAQVMTSVENFILVAGRLLDVSAFGAVIKEAIVSSDQRTTFVAYSLLTTRLSTVKSAKRSALIPAVKAAVTTLQQILSAAGDSKALKVRAMQLLRTLMGHAVEDELPAYSKALAACITAAEREKSKTLLTSYVTFIAAAISRLGSRVIPEVNRIVDLSLNCARAAMTDTADSTNKTIATSALTSLYALFTTVPTFVAPHLPKILDFSISADLQESVNADQNDKVSRSLDSLQAVIAKKTQAKILISAISQLWHKVDKSAYQGISGVVQLLLRALRHNDATTINDLYKNIFSLLLEIFDVRKLAEESWPIDNIEGNSISCFMTMVMKLNEGTFKPLFLRLYDWAVIADADAPLPSRKITLFKVVDRMLSSLRSIAVPYFAYTLDQACDILESGEADFVLWSSILSSLRRALEHDDIGFWTSARLGKLVKPFVEQVEVHSIDEQQWSRPYNKTLQAFAVTVESNEGVLHQLVRQLLEKTRSEDEDVQIATVHALESLWDAGIQSTLAAYSPESMPFLVELLEGGGEIERATKSLLAKMNEDMEDVDDEDDSMDEDSDSDAGSAESDASD